MRQADQLRAELAQRTRMRTPDRAGQGRRQSGHPAHPGVRRRSSTRPWTPKAKAHQTAAQSALTARATDPATLTETSNQIDQITAKLKDGLKVTLDADTSARFDKAIADLDKAIAGRKQYLLKIQADLQEAERSSAVRAAAQGRQDAAGRCRCVEGQGGAGQAQDLRRPELAVRTEGGHGEGAGRHHQRRGHDPALDRIQTESRTTRSAPTPTQPAEIMSLNGANTSSTHTIYVQRVEVNATGGLVGARRAGALPTAARVAGVSRG